jgi:hypothetical protein
MLRTFTAAIAAGFTLAASALGQTVTTDQIDRFIAVVTELQDFETRYPDVAADLEVQARGDLSAMINQDGEIAAFERMIGRLPAGEARSEITSVAKRNGFGSLDEFATVGDDIMMAFIALQMEGQDMAAMANQMPAEQLAMMPPNVRAQIETALRMAEVAKSVPPASVEAVRSRKTAIETAFDE